jgi:hypothetical protein
MLVTFISFIATSQSLSLKTSDGAKINNGDTITLTNANATADFTLNLAITNSSSSPIEIKAKKTELSIITGSINYFCSWTSCYQPGTYVTPDSLPLAAGASFSPFIVDYESEGNAGKSTVMYTFYDRTDNNDSIAVIVNYIAGFVGIESNEKNVTLSKAYPNPTKNAFYLDYNFSNTQNARVEVINVIGSVVKVQEIQGLNGKTMIDVSNLNNGVYFYSVIVDGKKYVSKKLIIQK